MSSSAVPAFGTFIQREDPSNPGTYGTVAEVGDIDGPQMSADMEDVTSHSTGIPWREKIPTLLSAGVISLPVFFNPQLASHSSSSGFLRAFKNREVGNWKIIFVDAGNTVWPFSGFVKSFKLKSPIAGVYKATVEIELTGQPTLN